MIKKFMFNIFLFSVILNIGFIAAIVIIFRSPIIEEVAGTYTSCKVGQISRFINFLK